MITGKYIFSEAAPKQEGSSPRPPEMEGSTENPAKPSSGPVHLNPRYFGPKSR